MKNPLQDLASNLQEGIKLINSLSIDQLEKIINCFHLSNNSPIEEKKLDTLSKTTGINEDRLNTIISTLDSILTHLCKFVVKPKDLQEQLMQYFEFSEKHSEVIIKYWSKEINEVLSKINNGEQLEYVSWQLSLRIASSNQKKMKLPIASIQFNLSTGENNEMRKVNIEADHKQLSMIFEEMEKIQAQLDALKKDCYVFFL